MRRNTSRVHALRLVAVSLVLALAAAATPLTALASQGGPGGP